MISHPSAIALYSDAKRVIYQAQVAQARLSMDEYRKDKQAVLARVADGVRAWWETCAEEAKQQVLNDAYAAS
jgi:hypothetical protein